VRARSGRDGVLANQIVRAAMEAQDPYAFDASRCTGREDDDTKTVDPAEVGCVYTDSIEVEETQRSILIDEKVERERQGPAPRPPMPWHCEEKEEAILASDFHRSFLEALKKTKMSRGPPDETAKEQLKRIDELLEELGGYDPDKDPTWPRPSPLEEEEYVPGEEFSQAAADFYRAYKAEAKLPLTGWDRPKYDWVVQGLGSVDVEPPAVMTEGAKRAWAQVPPLPEFPHEMDVPNFDQWGGAAANRDRKGGPPTCPCGLEEQGAELKLAMEAAFADDRGDGFCQRGALVYGGYGSGKTILAQWLAYECDVHCEWNAGPVCMRKDIGVVESCLIDRFERAKRHAPCLLVFDMIDDVVPADENGAARRVGSAFCAELEALATFVKDAPTRVFVLGMTAKREGPKALYDGLCRGAGRLGLVVKLPNPNRKARKAALRRALPADQCPVEGGDATLGVVARRCRGYTLADLESIGRRAILKTGKGDVIQKETLLEITKGGPPSRDSDLAGARWLTPEDLEAAPGGGCPLAGRRAKELFARARRDVVEPLLEDSSDEEDEGAKRPKRKAGGAVFYGPSGCGKTALARAVAGEAATLGVAALEVRCNDLLQAKLGASEKAIADVFQAARDQAPCVMLLDQIDTLGGPRGNDTTTEGSMDRVVSMLLLEMDGMQTSDAVAMIATSEWLCKLDEALLRPGRLGTRLCCHPPDEDERLDILKHHAGGSRLDAAAQACLPDLAKQTAGFSGADLAGLCRAAARRRFSEYCRHERPDRAETVKVKDGVEWQSQRKPKKKDSLVAGPDPEKTGFLEEAQRKLREAYAEAKAAPAPAPTMPLYPWPEDDDHDEEVNDSKRPLFPPEKWYPEDRQKGRLPPRVGPYADDVGDWEPFLPPFEVTREPTDADLAAAAAYVAEWHRWSFAGKLKPEPTAPRLCSRPDRFLL